MPQYPDEASIIGLQKPGKAALEKPRTGVLSAAAAEKVRAHHGRKGKGHERRNEDRGRDRHRELAKQTADQPAHEQERYEDGDQGKTDRNDGEADLAGALD